MNTDYLLTQLVTAGRAMRKAQKEYYARPGPVKADPIKKGLLQEAQRREQDFDKLLLQVEKIFPVKVSE